MIETNIDRLVELDQSNMEPVLLRNDESFDATARATYLREKLQEGSLLFEVCPTGLLDAYLLANPMDGGGLYLDSIQLRPNMSGFRRAKALIAILEAVLDRVEISANDALICDTHADNQPLIDLVMGLGFRESPSPSDRVRYATTWGDLQSRLRSILAQRSPPDRTD
jgi:hypothetical protein